MDLIFSVNNNEEIMIFPVVPAGIGPEIPQENEDFDSIVGTLKLIGKLGNRTMTIESFWPVNKNYSFVRPGSESDGWLYVSFFERWREKQVPFRVILTTADGATRLNMACVINHLYWEVDKVGDIQYKLEIEEYKFVR